MCHPQRNPALHAPHAVRVSLNVIVLGGPSTILAWRFSHTHSRVVLYVHSFSDFCAEARLTFLADTPFFEKLWFSGSPLRFQDKTWHIMSRQLHDSKRGGIYSFPSFQHYNKTPPMDWQVGIKIHSMWTYVEVPVWSLRCSNRRYPDIWLWRRDEGFQHWSCIRWEKI